MTARETRVSDTLTVHYRGHALKSVHKFLVVVIALLAMQTGKIFHPSRLIASDLTILYTTK